MYSFFIQYTVWAEHSEKGEPMNNNYWKRKENIYTNAQRHIRGLDILNEPNVKNTLRYHLVSNLKYKCKWKRIKTFKREKYKHCIVWCIVCRAAYSWNIGCIQTQNAHRYNHHSLKIHSKSRPSTLFRRH